MVPVIAAVIAATLSTSVAIGGRHANSASETVLVVVTMADTTLVVEPFVARTIESRSRVTPTRMISSRRAIGGNGR